MVNGNSKNVKYLTIFVSVQKKEKNIYIINIHYMYIAVILFLFNFIQFWVTETISSLTILIHVLQYAAFPSDKSKKILSWIMVR